MSFLARCSCFFQVGRKLSRSVLLDSQACTTSLLAPCPCIKTINFEPMPISQASYGSRGIWRPPRLHLLRTCNEPTIHSDCNTSSRQNSPSCDKQHIQPLPLV